MGKEPASSTKSKRSPALWATTMYYAQGLPFYLVRNVAQVYFKDLGVAREKLGLIALYGNAWTFKPFWSPLVDKFSTKRRWVLFMEAALALLVAALAIQADKGADVWTAIMLLGFISIFSATHDIATDGLYLEALSKDDQAKYSGWIVAFYRLAQMTGSGFLVKLAGSHGWGAAFGAPAIIFGGILLWHFFLLPETRPAKSEAKGYEKLIEGFKTFFQLPGIWKAIPFFLLFKLGDALLFGMSTPFLLDAGLTKQQLGNLNGYLGIASAVGASVFGGWFISRFKLRRGLWIFGFIQNLAIPVYAWLARIPHPEIWMFGTAIVVEQIAAALGTAAYSNFLMRQTDPRYRATHYAIASGMMSFTTMIGGAISGYGVNAFGGYSGFFVVAFFASLPGFFLVPWIARRPECQ